ncbi:hypothetical protein CASFOL_002491 [Castilleja foliolosa]|uniref:Integrase catalytic domain-containing protein n=1 Tax=Castilleja foliolosa TaxID=1961234 RepID=A0ABD3EI75_9LAMI
MAWKSLLAINPTYQISFSPTTINLQFLIQLTSCGTGKNQILASWILSSLSENILALMIGLSSSSQIWHVLESNFASQSKAKTLQYKLQLQTTKKGNLSMREYLAKVKMCCDLLATTGNPVSQSDQLMHILSGLGSEYDPVMVTVTAGINSFGLNDVQALLLSFEARLENAMSMSSAGAINTDGSQPTVKYASQENYQKKNSSPRGRGGNSNFRGGFRGRGGRMQGGGRITCQVCHVPGHSADRCWHRYDQTYGVQGSTQSNAGDTNNQSRNPSLNMVHIPGTNATNEEGYWFPDSGATTHVTNDFNCLQSASEYNGTSKLQMGNGHNEQISHIGKCILHSNQSAKLFYLKDLLHVSGITKNLMSVSRFALDNGVYFEFHPSFCLVKDLATRIFSSGEHLKKDSISFSWIIILLQGIRILVTATFIHFHNYVETQFKWKIKSVQSDGGTEYKSLSEFFKKNGIVHRISCPYTPEKNGCAERKHRYVEMGLSLLAQSDMPLKYWDDYFTTATYLINRIPAKVLNYSSPFEKLMKQKPDYKSLKVFGCLSYPHIRPYNKDKLEFRASPGVFIGYSSQYKGYKILLPSGKIVITRHVLFDESIFPFSKPSSTENRQQNLAKTVFASSEPTVATFLRRSNEVEGNTHQTQNSGCPIATPVRSSESHSSNDSFESIQLRVVK